MKCAGCRRPYFNRCSRFWLQFMARARPGPSPLGGGGVIWAYIFNGSALVWRGRFTLTASRFVCGFFPLAPLLGGAGCAFTPCECGRRGRRKRWRLARILRLILNAVLGLFLPSSSLMLSLLLLLSQITCKCFDTSLFLSWFSPRLRMSKAKKYLM